MHFQFFSRLKESCTLKWYYLLVLYLPVLILFSWTKPEANTSSYWLKRANRWSRLTATKSAKGTAHPIYNLHINGFLSHKNKNESIKAAVVTEDVNDVHYRSKVWNKFRFYNVFKVSSAHQGSIYLMKNTVKAIILWNIITIQNNYF